MIEDDVKFSLSFQESENINLKMESYTIIGNADAFYNKGYADGEEYGKKNAPSEDFSVTLTANGTYKYPKPGDKYHKDLSITVAVPSDYGKGYDDGYSKGDSDGYDRGYASGKEEGLEEGLEEGYNKALEEYDLDQLLFIKTSDESYNSNSTRAFTEYITEIDFAKFSEKHKKTNFYNFFYYWGGKSLTVKNLDTSNAISLRNMFYKCDYLTYLDVKGFDTSKVTNLYYAFSGCSSLKELDLSTWNTENVTDVTRMFSNNGSLEKLNLSSWHLPKVKSLSNVFIGCSKLKDIIWGQNWADNKDFTSLELTVCPLSKECIIDLADKIQDKSDTSLFPNTYKVVIASSQKSQFTEYELTSLANRFTSKNWSLVWS